MRSKSEQFASALGNQDFKASTNWLNGFKDGNGISFKAVCGESGAVNIQAADEWRKHLKEIIQEKKQKNIFNVDETGRFYKCIPNKILAFKREACSG
ncbi:hypothetical protein AVEN_179319-1 [Araneus ventricosus]|uniref:HTH CENPB-type domain-containing protein n=1 Tax=Araneus ventricosus TaxID=182803 RepID=A0A4Y2H1C9_ARAVE|nr:hypothetical protein AVEN_179319-1 [Araneus ventricosus]